MMQDYSAIREEVAKLCAAFPGPSLQAKGRPREYPSNSSRHWARRAISRR